MLGDLYVRAGQIDKGVEQFTRIADHLADEGFYPKAAALYKKILKLKPATSRRWCSRAKIAARQGLLADAKQYFNQPRRSSPKARGEITRGRRSSAFGSARSTPTTSTPG